MHGLMVFLGLTDPSGPWYLFWSGIVGDLPEFAVFVLVWRRVNCHARGCWRVGLHAVNGTPYRVCRTHHPRLDSARPPTAEQIANSEEGGTP